MEIHAISEQLLMRVETLEQQLEVKGCECEELVQEVEAKQEHIDELANDLKEYRKSLDGVTKLTAKDARKRVAQLEVENAKLTRVNEEAQQELDRIKRQLEDELIDLND